MHHRISASRFETAIASAGYRIRRIRIQKSEYVTLMSLGVVITCGNAGASWAARFLYQTTEQSHRDIRHYYDGASSFLYMIGALLPDPMSDFAFCEISVEMNHLL
jgi:hypothetical protein